MDKKPPTKHPSCGSISGYTLHKNRREYPCESCKTANREYDRARRGNKPFKPAECGTYSGYYAHRKREEKACDACAEARREYNRARTGAKPRNKVQCGTVSGYTTHRAKEEEPCLECREAWRGYSKRQREDNPEASRAYQREYRARKQSDPQRKEQIKASRQRLQERLRNRTTEEADLDFLRLRGSSKRCKSCQENLPADSFPRNWLEADGRARRCNINGCFARYSNLKRSRKLRSYWSNKGIDPDKCLYCIRADSEDVEHVMPKSRGGSDDLENLAPSCRECNRGLNGKHDKDPLKWLTERFPERVQEVSRLYPHITVTES